MRPPIRSFLFVPGDSEKKLEKMVASEADALVLDLEDSVAPPRKAEARRLVAAYLRSGGTRPGLELWVRVNPLTSPDNLEDVAAVVGAGPAGLLLPKTEGPQDVRRLGHYLDALEAREGLPARSIEVIAVATETAAATFALGQYRGASLDRLYGLTWGAEDLSADIGAATNKDADGQLSLTYRLARSNMLLGAKAAGVHALETAYPDFRNIDLLRATLDAARREGFSGGFAIHPAQIEALNGAFSPSADEIAQAERVIAAFDANPAVGTIGIDGKMYDRPHLVQARKIVALRDAFMKRG
jgi:citrate lyase subunit beta / citryl-CoA lyase